MSAPLDEREAAALAAAQLGVRRVAESLRAADTALAAARAYRKARQAADAALRVWDEAEAALRVAEAESTGEQP